MPAYDRAALFRSVRASFGNLGQSQVDGFNAILAEADRRGGLDPRYIAYMLATAWWETAHTMQAIREYGLGKSHDYGKADPTTGQTYYGRGLVQLTHKANYQTMSGICGVDLVANPDLALQLDTAVKIMFEGMLAGSFTGKKLADYFNARGADWVNARRIINGTDRAALIAGFAQSFNKALVLIEDEPTRPAPAAADASAETRQVQAALVRLGYTQAGLADGIAGSKTHAAVAAFQREHDGLPATGLIDDATRKAILDLDALLIRTLPPIAPSPAPAGPSPAPESGSKPATKENSIMGNLLGSVASIIEGVITKGNAVAAVPAIVGGAFKSIDEAKRGLDALVELVSDVRGGKWDEVPQDITAILTEFKKIMVNFGIDHDKLNVATTKLAKAA